MVILIAIVLILVIIRMVIIVVVVVVVVVVVAMIVVVTVFIILQSLQAMAPASDPSPTKRIRYHVCAVAAKQHRFSGRLRGTVHRRQEDGGGSLRFSALRGWRRGLRELPMRVISKCGIRVSFIAAMAMRIPPLKTNILPNPLKSRILVRRSAVSRPQPGRIAAPGAFATFPVIHSLTHCRHTTWRWHWRRGS